jgi:hypothetical protein
MDAGTQSKAIHSHDCDVYLTFITKDSANRAGSRTHLGPRYVESALLTSEATIGEKQCERQEWKTCYFFFC